MHADKYALIVDPLVKQALLQLAVDFGVTVDALVSGGIGRGPISAEVQRALEVAPRELFKGLERWPLDCPFCGVLVDPAAVKRCVSCGRRGCAACGNPTGCPVCLEARRKEALARRAATAAAAADGDK